jgi:DNA-binding IclR family transcriptional regulator
MQGKLQKPLPPVPASPTARLILTVLANATTLMSIANLCEASGSAPTTVIRVAQKLCRQGRIQRTTVSGMTYYSIPTEAGQQ